jgi:hypothetical protein
MCTSDNLRDMCRCAVMRQSATAWVVVAGAALTAAVLLGDAGVQMVAAWGHRLLILGVVVTVLAWAALGTALVVGSYRMRGHHHAEEAVSTPVGKAVDNPGERERHESRVGVAVGR